MRKLIAFDLDDTLAPSKSPLPVEMASLVAELLEHRQVCVISGAHFSQFSGQFLAQLPESTQLDQLHLMPACGTQYFRFVGGEWRCVYSEPLSPADRRRAIEALEAEARALDLWETHTWGPILEDRQSQVTFSALGQGAPPEAKASWDPAGNKRAALVEAVRTQLPHLSVRAGGSTSVDITREGIDKGYGIRRLVEVTGIPIQDMAFIGDRLDPDGNDYPVLATGIEATAVRNWTETAQLVRKIIAGHQLERL